MKKLLKNWTFLVAVGLILASATSYFIHFLIFRDPHHIFIYMIGDIAFLFIDVLLVLLIIERLMSRQEKKSILLKLNMVIGTFFSEVGMDLLKRFSDFVENAEDLEKDMILSPQWTQKRFQEAADRAESFPYDIKLDIDRLEELRDFLRGKHAFLVRLLENPNLQENEKFTDLLWAVFHLAEELQFRESLKGLPETDLAHLKVDLRRAYSRIVAEWIQHAAHLKERYPFLFSLAVRVNPLNPKASPVVGE